MELPEERIHKDGEVLDGDVLRVNSFPNHQADPEFMIQVGVEFRRLFGNEEITKVLICETSGIVPGTMAAYQLGVPIVFTRKKKPSTLNDIVYWADVFPYTKKVSNKICIERKFLSSDDHLSIVDDFLVYGEAAKRVLNITKQADASVAGVGMAVAKESQSGSDWTKEHGYRPETLTGTVNFESNQVHFVGGK